VAFGVERLLGCSTPDTAGPVASELAVAKSVGSLELLLAAPLRLAERFLSAGGAATRYAGNRGSAVRLTESGWPVASVRAFDPVLSSRANATPAAKPQAATTDSVTV
jgi:hypothetical protein